MRKVLLIGALVAGALAGVGSPASAVGSFEVVNLFFGSSLGNVGVDVCIDGDEVATDLPSGERTGALSSAADTVALRVALHEDGAACDAKASVFIDEAAVAVAEGGFIVLHNGANDVGGAEPVFTTLPGPTCVDADTARLTVVHAANAGPVDVVADGSTVIDGLANGEARSLEVPGGTAFAEVAVVPAGGGEPVLAGPLAELVEGEEAIVAAVGGVGAGETRLYDLVVLTRGLEVCSAPTTTIVPDPEPAPSPQASPAEPVAAAPTFTG
ncbi:MAG: DUF4397 domain-containing protein [Acidimicrobiales bacterium]|nr:DUF4397 domain-containing protein [Acidimicrobiales bacterium]